MSEDDSFLSRWSRRKRAAETLPPEPAESVATEPAQEATEVADAETDPPLLTEDELAALPRIEDLTSESDISAFLRPGVPAELKNAALRRTWMLTPAIRDYLDPAVDYAWDWNTPGGVPGDGCGPTPERAARMLRDLLDPPQPQPAEAPEQPPAEVAGAADSSPQEAPAETDTNSENPIYMNDVAEASLPRRRHGGALPT